MDVVKASISGGYVETVWLVLIMWDFGMLEYRDALEIGQKEVSGGSVYLE